MENVLTRGDMTNQTLGNGVTVTKYFTEDTAGCFISNTNQSNDATATLEGNQYLVPAWSVSILPDCKNEVYNTAKMNTQTSIMVKKSAGPTQLNWRWRPEDMKSTLKGKGTFTKHELTEQIVTTLDASDYLCYMTKVNFKKKDQMTLHVNTTGHVLHAFLNGLLVGSHYAPNGGFMFVFESPVNVKRGKNYISLLSATVGLKNYGSQFELMSPGVVGGPVQLIGNGNSAAMDLSTNPMSYKIGLKDEEQRLYKGDAHHNSEWRSSKLPI